MKNRAGIIAAFALTAGLLLTVLAYWPGLQGPFLLDDNNNLQPAQVESLSHDVLLPVVMSNHSGRLGRPISTLSFALNYYISGYDPFAYKYVNLMIHLITGLLLFWLGGRLLGHLLPAQHHTRAWTIAGLTAAIWLAHPLNVSTVLYAVQRMAQLPTLFMLAALLCYVIGRQSLIRGHHGWTLIIIGPAFFGLLAVFSKENGALLPLFILLLEFTVFHLSTTEPRDRRRLLWLLTAFCITPLIVGLIFFITHADSLLGGYIYRSFTLHERLLTEAHVLFFYMRLVLLPNLSAMGLFHDDFPLTSNIDLVTGLMLIGLLAMVVSVVLLRKRAPVLALGLGWFLIAHAIESTVFPLELVFEHRNYLAAFGLIFPVIYYLYRLNRLSHKPIPVWQISGLTIALLLSSMTAIRANTWSDLDLLVMISVENHPHSQRANTEMANFWFRRDNLEEGRKHLDRAARLTPQDPGPLLHKLFSYCNEMDLPQGLLEETVRLLRSGKISPYAIDTIGLIQKRIYNNRCQAAEALELSSLTEAALSNPIKKKQSFLHFYHARFLSQAGDKDTAMKHLRMSFDKRKSQPMQMSIPALLELATLQIDTDGYQQAVATINEIETLNQSLNINYDKEILHLKLLMAKRLEERGLLQ